MSDGEEQRGQHEQRTLSRLAADQDLAHAKRHRPERERHRAPGASSRSRPSIMPADVKRLDESNDGKAERWPRE